MTTKKRLIQKRHEPGPLIEILDSGIESCLRSIERRRVRPTASDIVNLVRLRLERKPIKRPSPATILRAVSDHNGASREAIIATL
jgi:hypothetical protein